MSRLVFVTGGARSGKTGFAMSLAEKAYNVNGGGLVYLATATAGDAEMEERISRHKDERGAGWRTIEEPIDIAGALVSLGQDRGTVVLDCLTLWLSNLMMADDLGFESVARAKAAELLYMLKDADGTVIVVSNEVGLGIVPDNPVARRFRDVAGWVNRTLAESADEAYLVVAGMPIKIKGAI